MQAMKIDRYRLRALALGLALACALSGSAVA